MINKHTHKLVISTILPHTHAHKFFLCTKCERVFLVRIVNNAWHLVTHF